MSASFARAWAACLWLGLGACGGHAPQARTAAEERPDPPLPPLPWASGAVDITPGSSPLTAIVGGRVMTAAGAIHDPGVVVMEGGVVRAVGSASDVEVPDGAAVVDATGRVVTPGLIDTHSHMGVYAAPSLRATSDGNEATSPNTSGVWAADSFWPQDPALPRAVAGGVTTIQVLPGSANLIGGRGAIFKLHLGRSASEMLFPGAPDTLKMACGENPKRVYGGRNSAPSTRMGNVLGYRAAFQQAVEYGRSWTEWQQKHRQWQVKRILFDRAEAERRQASASRGGEGVGREDGEDDSEDGPDDPGPAPNPPARDFGQEALLGVLEGRVLVQMHCYRADEMARMIEIGDEFGFAIRSFHHALEAYKVRDLLSARGIGVSTWADWWGGKLEMFDAIPQNLALLSEAGVPAILHSDSNMLVQRLHQEAAKAMWAGRHAGVDVSTDTALRWITANPAWALGIEDRTGTLEPGRMADVVVWSGDPFSVYTRADLVFIDGLRVYDRATSGAQPAPTDFEVGLDLEGGRP